MDGRKEREAIIRLDKVIVLTRESQRGEWRYLVSQSVFSKRNDFFFFGLQSLFVLGRNKRMRFEFGAERVGENITWS